jgi:alanyl-tRNA synthetase
VAHFTTGEDQLLAAVQRLSEQNREARHALRATEQVLQEAEADKLRRQAPEYLGVSVVVTSYLGTDREPSDVKALATRLSQFPGCVALLAWQGDKVQLTFTRSADVQIDMGALMRDACSQLGGRGGGRPDWAQGGGPVGVPVVEVLQSASDAVRTALADT